MTKYLFKIWITGMLVAAMSMAGCSDEPTIDEPEQPAEVVGDRYIRFRINVNGDGPADAPSRAGETEPATPPGATEPETPGTTYEDKINSVDIFVYDVETEVMTGMLHLEKNSLGKLTSEGVIVPISVRKGQKLHIYAGVNFTEEMRYKFHIGMRGTASSLVSTGSSYRDVMNTFVPGSNGLQETLEAEAGCIPMTGQFIDPTVKPATPADPAEPVEPVDPTVIELGPENSTALTAKPIVADVSRIVAKIHVLAEATEGFDLSTGEKNVRYAKAVDGSQAEDGTDKFANWIGWIRLDNVRFLPNSANRSSYLFAQKNAEGSLYGWRDPNMNIDSYVIGGHTAGGDLNFDGPASLRDYAFYSGEALHKENISPESGFAKAEAYDEIRLNNTLDGSSAENRYTRGLYCTENYFDTPTLNADALKQYDDAIPMVTHVSIAARLTPRYLVLTKDFATTMQTFVDNYTNNGGEAVLEEYGLTEEDFNDVDVARWNTMKDSYGSDFTGDDNLYRNVYRMIKMKNEADAQYLLKWSLQIHKLWSATDDQYDLGKYPAGTYYAYDRKYESSPVMPISSEWNQGFLYLTAGAVAAATDENKDIKTYSIPHVGGWGYYYTYLDQLHTGKNEVPYTSSQVTRNTYYIITIGNFGVPGGSISHPEYIRVNTDEVGWDYDGRGNINLH